MPPFQNQLAQIIAEFGRSTAGVPAAEQEKTVEIAVRTETINRTLDFFLARAATNPITHAKLDYKWDSKGLRLSQRYWPTVRMLLQSVNLVLRWRATATKIGWNSIEVEAWDGDAVRYEYEDQQIIVSQLDEQEPTHTSFFIAGKNNSLSSLQSPARRTAEAAISRYNRDRRQIIVDTRFDPGDAPGHGTDDYIRAQAEHRLHGALRSEKAGQLVAFHEPQLEIGDVIRLPDASLWRIRGKRVSFSAGDLLDTLTLQAP